MCWSVLTPSNHLPSSSRTQESLCLHWQGDTKEKIWLECDWRRLPIFYLVFRKLCAERRAPFQTHRAVTCHQHSRKPHFCAPFSWALWDRGITRWTDGCSSYIEGLHCQRATKQWQHKNPWMKHNFPHSMRAQSFCPFLDVGISIFKGPDHAAFISIL